MNSDSDAVVALTTCASETDAERLAEYLVAQRLAACVNIVPGVKSVYRWQGEIERAPEVLLIIKTLRSRLLALAEGLEQNSGYELPELVAVPVPLGSAAYLDWVAASVRD